MELKILFAYVGCCELADAMLAALGDRVGGASGKTRVLATYL